jgi:hypothetical protein
MEWDALVWGVLRCLCTTVGFPPGDIGPYICTQKARTVIYRMVKKSLCTWWLQYRKLQVMFKVSPADRQGQGDTRLTLTPYVIPNSNYVIVVSDWNCLKYFCVFFYCNHQVHRDFLITLYIRRKIQITEHTYIESITNKTINKNEKDKNNLKCTEA